MDISLLTLLFALALGTFALGFIFSRLAKLARLSSPARQFATEGALATHAATPEPADVLTHTQLHYQQTHINGLNTNIRMLEEKLRWLEEDRQEADGTIADLQRRLREASGPRGDEVTQREAEIALLRAQLDAAISNASKLERKLIRAESDALTAREETQELRARLWAQQSTDVALSRLQDRQTALQNAIQEHLHTRDQLARDVVMLNAALSERETALAERTAALNATERRLLALNEEHARLVARENAWEKLHSTLADAQAQATQAEAARDDALVQIAGLTGALEDAGAQRQQVTERLHALHEALALRDGQVTELHGEVRRLQQAGAEAQQAFAVAEAEAAQQREMLEAALLLATGNLESLREQLNDAEASRLLLEAELQNKAAALELATDDLSQLSSREFELTVALERSGREHQSSFETALLHMSRVEAELAQAQAALATQTEAAGALAQQLHDAQSLLEAEQARAGELADAVSVLEMTRTTLETHLQAKAAVMATAEAVISSMQDQLSQRDQQLADLLTLAGERGSALEMTGAQLAELEAHLQDARTLAETRAGLLATLEAQLAEAQAQLADLRILATERARAIESAHAQIAHLSGGLDELNSTANEKFAALQAEQQAHEAAQTRITTLEAEQAALRKQLAVAGQRNEALAVEIASLHDALSSASGDTAALQTKLSEAQAEIATLQDAQAAAAGILEAQAGEIIALAKAREESETALHMAEARVADLMDSLAGMQSALDARQAALATLQPAHTLLLAEKAALDGEINTLQDAQRRLEAELHELQTGLAQAGGQAASLDAELREKTAALVQAQASLGDMRYAQALLLQEHDAARQTRDALELQTRNQMERLVEMSNEAAEMQRRLQAVESDLLAAQTELAEAQQRINSKPEPGTVEARLVDVTLTLRRLEKEYAALQAEKDAIEDEYSREQIAGQLRIQEREGAIRACGAQVDALQIELAVLKAKSE
jgi:chromosome segregation ATPase